MIFILGTLALPTLAVRGFRDGKEWNRVEHQTIEDLPVLQTVGRVARKPELRVKLRPELCDPAAILNAVDVLGDRGVAVPLQLGNGALIGWFVLTAVNRDWVWTLPDGAIIEADLTISLRESRTPEPDLGPLLGIVGLAPVEFASPVPIDTSVDPSDIPLAQAARL